MVLRAILGEATKSIKPELDKIRAQTEVKIAINTLDLGIQSILENMQAPYQPEIKNRLLGALAEVSIFPSIPNDVTSISLSDGTQLNRRESEVSAIEEKKRRTWSLEEVDQLASSYASSINQPRVPKLPKNP